MRPYEHAEPERPARPAPPSRTDARPAAGNAAVAAALHPLTLQRGTGTYDNQPTIDSVLGGAPMTFAQQPHLPYHFAPHEVVIAGSDDELTATVPGIGDIGELQLITIGGVTYVNHIAVHPRARRRGVGRRLIAAAIGRNGRIHGWTGTAAQETGPGDTRHLSHEGAALVAACIAAGMNIGMSG